MTIHEVKLQAREEVAEGTQANATRCFNERCGS